MRMSTGALGILLLAAADPGVAEIYRWTDPQGTLHFSQSLDQVPPAYRAAARRSAESDPGPDPVQTVSPPPASLGGRSSRLGGRPMRIPFRRYGSLMRVNAVLNDELNVELFVDTGASGVALPDHVIERLGIRVDADTPRVVVQTANGVVTRPVVQLGSVQLGPARVESLSATVNPAMDIGLLGGAFFNNFVYRIDAAAGMIELVPNQAIRGGRDEREWREIFRSVRDPLAALEAYLEGAEVVRKGEREALERKRGELRARLEALEREARRSGVPVSWRY